jgi:hypothetical protein
LATETFPETPLGQFIAFVMILGYGIAVPTGIVTAEIAKSTQNKIVTDTKNHVPEDYPENANFSSLWTFV